MERAKYRDCQECIEIILEKTLTDGGRPVSVAMVDDHGDLVAFGRMDGASPRSVTIALNKAYTAARMGRDTHIFAQRLAENRYDPSWFGDPRFTGLKGGVALKVGEGCVGGIGVAGRSVEKDFELAQCALANMKKKLAAQP
jgi:glc operon protein GlcG